MDGIKNILVYEIAIVAAALIASAIIISNFFTPLLLAAITAYILYPLVSKIQKKVYFYDAAVGLTALILFAPLVVSANYIAGDVSSIISSISALADQVSGFLANLNEYAAAYGLDKYVENLPNIIKHSSGALQERLIGILSNLPRIFLSIVVYVISAYYMLRDGYKLKNLVSSYANTLHIRDREAINNFIAGLKNSFDVLFIAHFGMAIVTGVLVGIGLYLFGVPYPAVFSILVAIFAFLPIFGAWMAYVSAALLFYASTGNASTTLMIIGWGVLFGNIIPDFMIKPWLGSKVGNVHPLTILLGFIGGPFIFGMKGFILGPIILVIAENVLLGFIQFHTRYHKHLEHAKKK